MKEAKMIIFSGFLTALMEQDIISEKFMTEIMKRLMLYNGTSETSINHNVIKG